MTRPKRCRVVSGCPRFAGFGPEDDRSAAGFCEERVVLNLDEFETIRLLDFERLTQSECAEAMHVARTTVTDIYDRARYKIADCLVNGKRLVIAGGSYRYGDQITSGWRRLNQKGEKVMRVAVTYENGEVFQHFGRTESFKIFDVADGKATAVTILETNGTGHGALAGFLREADVDAVICGGIGPGAQDALAEEGITVYAGASGSVDEAAKALAEGRLSATDGATCDHHAEGHAEGHSCGHGGEHACGHGEGHTCGHGEGHACGHGGGHCGH